MGRTMLDLGEAGWASATLEDDRARCADRFPPYTDLLLRLLLETLHSSLVEAVQSGVKGEDLWLTGAVVERV